MGILNVTPDSFSDGGQFSSTDKAITHALEMCTHGAHIIDIGGESTRPGADVVSEADELARILPVIEGLVSENLSAQISIDTRRPKVAKAAIKAGASIWNDVTALSFEANSISMAAELGCEIVLMHMKGTPKTMQENPVYDNVVDEVCTYLKRRLEAAMAGGVQAKNIILDPGIGFGKRLEDNLLLLAEVDDLNALGYRVLIGASRKNFISMIDKSPADARLGGSLASALWAANLGASIVRVHDVKETAQALKVWQAMRKQKNG
ncbi:MAG: dihydropteroate synthase [Robiginitomaculum sp.]|nr:MAG: dihydropteroate synthase [Robiginitomaculum sp.]